MSLNKVLVRCFVTFLLLMTFSNVNLGLGLASRDFNFNGDDPKLMTNVSTAVYDTPYLIEVNRTIEYIFQFRNNAMSLTRPARITVECKNSNRSFPVLIVVRQQKGVLSWQLPLIVETKSGLFGYVKTSRTLCPDNNYYAAAPGGQSQSMSTLAVNKEVIVSISTASPTNLTVSLDVSLEHDFFLELSTPRNITIVSPTEPRYFGFKFPSDGPSTVVLRVDSPDEICMTVSVQNMSCPVFDLERNVQFEGYWQTMNKRGGITLTRSAFPLGLYVVLVVKGDDSECSGQEREISPPRDKSVSFSLSPGISVDDYLVATFGVLAVFVVFYVFTILVAVLHFIRYRRNLQRSAQTEDSASPDQSGAGSVPGRRASGSVSSGRGRTSSDSSLDETDIDMLHDADRDKDIFRTKTGISVHDLARKHPRILQKKSQLYFWNLLTVGMFYGLPVVQLVITYQNVLNQTGNQDLCYYNFLCSHPFGFLSDFNHVYSNVGYVLLGLLFIVLTYRREFIHKTAAAHLDRSHGIPQHFGLFYAMGAALMMEGIMSACYHVCPNHSNFQFDTSFMYVIALVCMVKIYQTRHPDINASAYATYGVLAAVIFIGMCGVLNGSLAFWIGFTCIHLSVCLLLTVQIYYMGRWKLDCGMFKRVFQSFYNDMRASPMSCLKPIYPNRMVLLLLGNACNWGLAVLGLKFHNRDFATYLLIIFMCNLMLYYTFYIVMKLLYGERILTQPLIYILLSFISWGAALYFFLNKSISWALTPAGSKWFNQPCKVLDFYDNHDIWHFLSAASMFFSFNSLLSLDDDLAFVHRTKIPVF